MKVYVVSSFDDLTYGVFEGRKQAFEDVAGVFNHLDLCFSNIDDRKIVMVGKEDDDDAEALYFVEEFEVQ